MNKLVTRLRGSYEVGVDAEFGMRKFPVPAIQVEAADRITELEAENNTLMKNLRIRDKELSDKAETLNYVIEQINLRGEWMSAMYSLVQENYSDLFTENALGWFDNFGKVDMFSQEGMPIGCANSKAMEGEVSDE